MNYASEFRGITSAWIQLLSPICKKQALTPEEHVFVTQDEAIKLAHLPGEEGDLAHWRDRAGAARLYLSGERASSMVTSPICAIDFSQFSVRQWPELGVQTKNQKRATTYLLHIPELIEVAQSWDNFVRSNLPSDAPWYAPIESRWGVQTLSAEEPGQNRNHALDRRLRKLFEQAGLPYKSAHKFRHGHAVYGLLHAKTMADYKAVSMNLMHEDVKITDSTYAPLLGNDVKNRIANLNPASISNQPVDDWAQMLASLPNTEISKLIHAAVERLAA